MSPKRIFLRSLLAASAAAILLLGAAPARAQSFNIGPDAAGYVATSVPADFEDISATGTRILNGIDDVTFLAPLGFTFGFYGQSFTDVHISSNGLLSFTAGNTQFGNVDLNTTSPIFDVPTVAVLWDDWQFFQAGTDAVYFQTKGPVGARRFIVQWRLAAGFASSPDFVTFQAVLFEGSNHVVLVYPDVISGDFRNNGGSATVGIRDTSGQLNGRRLQWSFNQPVIQNGQAILFQVPAPSGVIGPDAFGYVARSVPAAFQDISTTGTRVLDNVDDGAVSVPLGFGFNFYGQAFTALGISSNGLLTFGGLNASFVNTNLATQNQSLASIAPLWDDWDTRAADGGDAVYVQSFGPVGSRRFVVQWSLVDHFQTNTGFVTFQAILFEGSNQILFVYPDVDLGAPGLNNGGSATVGIAAANGVASGRNLQWSFNQAVIQNGQAILITREFQFGAVEGGGSTTLGNGTSKFLVFARTNASGAILGGTQFQLVFPGFKFTSLQVTSVLVQGNTARVAGRARVDGVGIFNYVAVFTDVANPGNGQDLLTLTLSNGTVLGPARTTAGNVTVNRLP